MKIAIKKCCANHKEKPIGRSRPFEISLSHQTWVVYFINYERSRGQNEFLLIFEGKIDIFIFLEESFLTFKVNIIRFLNRYIQTQLNSQNLY